MKNPSKENIHCFTACNGKNITSSSHSMGPHEARIWFSISTSAIAILSSTSNIIIIYIVVRKPDMRTMANLLIMNMAISDLCSTLVGGAEILNNLLNSSGWIGGFIGDVTCKLTFCTIYASGLSSLYSLLAISVDRFLAVKKPLQHKARVSCLKYVITSIWLVSFAIGGIVMFSFGLKNDSSTGPNCTFVSVIVAGTICICTSFTVSFITMTILYIIIGVLLFTRKIPGETTNRDRQTAIKATIMMVAVMLVFLISWTPAMLVDCVVWTHLYLPSTIPIAVIYILTACHGFLNLCIYVKLNEKFRKGFLEILRSLACRPVRSVQPTSNEVLGLGQINQGQDLNENLN